jgi:hypothetical protein
MSTQLPLFSGEREPRRLSVEVPLFPSAFRYVDDFTDTDHYFSDFDLVAWPLSNNGSMAYLRFERYSGDARLQRLIKVFVTDLIVRFSPGTTRLRLDGLAVFELDEIVSMIECAPDDSRELWDLLLSKRYSSQGYNGLKALLKFSAERSIGNWTPLYLPFLSSSLPLPSYDKFAAVRSGDVFIAIEDEATLVRWIYERSHIAAALATPELLDTALVICSYQFAMRPKQIGLLKCEHCRVLFSETGGVGVHLTFRMVKQRTPASAKTPLIRKIKREWAPIFAEIYARGQDEPGDSKLLGFASSAAVCVRLNELLGQITRSHWNATDLRHSGAMRQVDAGASAEDLAEFMGHSTLESGLVYYDASATQAERVNKALGLSEVYQNLAKLGVHKFISNDELSDLKGEQQIAGVPHGIAIAGIGGCQTGQPSCPYNPITACYGCPKFMPVNDTAIHRKVLEDFRGVVRFFYDSSRAEAASPAYLQLQRTISDVDAVIQELENTDEQ